MNSRIIRTISPPYESLSALRPALTAGEREVVDFFNQYLPIDWEIYIQPFLNGLRPDIVLLNPKVGIAVFEIKDWNLSAMHYYVNQDNPKSPVLMATNRHGRTFSLQCDNPIRKVHLYRQEIFDLYCPGLSAKNGLAVITAGVIMTRAPQATVDALFAPFTRIEKYPQYTPVVGREAIENGDILRVFPESRRYYSAYMHPSLAQDFRYWLVEPDFASQKRDRLVLNPQQQYLVSTRTESGYRRIRGAAGSGKSLVVAVRAAALAAQGLNVLVVSYNITLLRYLRNLTSHYAHQNGLSAKNISFVNFHYWCKRICSDYGVYDRYRALWKTDSSNEDVDSSNEDVLNERLPHLVQDVIQTAKSTDNFVPYDAILVDEGQDFRLTWWQTLRQALTPEGEMLLVQDTTQDVYQTSKAWTEEAMNDCGFRGKWAELQGSYRLPPALMRKVKQFIADYLPEDCNVPEPPAQTDLAFHPCGLKWIQVAPGRARDACLNEILQGALASAPNGINLSISDIVFLSSNRRFGWQIVTELGRNGIKTTHTFTSEDKDSRRNKMFFAMEKSTIKVTTLHSFKGWEARTLIIYLDETVRERSFPLVYAGLTRLKRHPTWSSLTIICASNTLKTFGKTWDNYLEIG